MKLFNITLVILVLLSCIMISCNTKSPVLSNNQIIENNVRSYFFMGDTVELKINVVDTIFIEELINMQENVNKNYNLAQIDIDTLDYAIGIWENKMYKIQDNMGSEDEINTAKVMWLAYQLNQTDTKIKQFNYKNSNRIFTNLQRSTVNNISGYELSVTYKITGETNTLSMLIDASLKVVD
jgi:hypothetical protein